MSFNIIYHPTAVAQIARMTMVSTPRILVGMAIVGLSAASARPAPTATTGSAESSGPDCDGALVHRTVWLMGTMLEATACAEGRDSGITALEDAFERVREAEHRLSTWDDRSELSRLNAAPAGTWVRLSAPTVTLLAEVRRWIVATEGTFDPAVGAAIAAWDLRGTGRAATPAELEAARRTAGVCGWDIDEAGRRARHGPGVRLDAGAFGKGAGLRAAAAALDHDGISWAVLDFGGQLLISSRDPALRWPVAVADPQRRDRPAVRLDVGPGSVATSGASERFVETDNGRVGHVIDPRTARPVPAWGSVTVVTVDPLVADILSTALFVTGPARAFDRALAIADAEMLALETTADGLAVHRTAGLDGVKIVRTETSFESPNPGSSDR